MVSVTQQLDLSGATKRLIAGVLFAVGEMELEAVKERQLAGIETAKPKGIYNTNGDRRCGYRNPVNLFCVSIAGNRLVRPLEYGCTVDLYLAMKWALVIFWSFRC